jgi:ATP-dependent DNA helicase RecQ
VSRAPKLTAEVWDSLERRGREFGWSALTVAQREVARELFAGRDLVAVQPSAAGARAVYQLVAPFFSGPTLVIGPRTAQLRDQHDRLLMRRSGSQLLVPGGRGSERLQTMQRLQELANANGAPATGAGGRGVLVHAAAELLDDEEFVRALARARLAQIIVEDAHAASSLGYELHAGYVALPGRLAKLRRACVEAGHAPAPVLLDTFVATAALTRDLVRLFALREPVIVGSTPVRDNLVLEAVSARGEAKRRVLAGLLSRLRRPGIVFCATDREVIALYGALTSLRIPVHRYHAGMSAGERGAELLNFVMPGRRTVMVATSAFAPALAGVLSSREASLDTDALEADAPSSFGVGLEKRDIRFVLHWQMPASLEQYLREVDLAGRDGELAHAVLFQEPADRDVLEAQLTERRLAPDAVFSLGRVLEQLEAPAPLDSVLRGAGSRGLAAPGLDRRRAERLLCVMESAGLARLDAGWVGRQTPAEGWALSLERLASAVRGLRQQDGARLAAVREYAEAARCCSSWLRRAFSLGADVASEGMGGPCVCSRCTGDNSLLEPIADVRAAGAGSLAAAAGSLSAAADDVMVPRGRRAPARELTVTPASSLDGNGNPGNGSPANPNGVPARSPRDGEDAEIAGGAQGSRL